jgi:hypothetical protein
MRRSYLIVKYKRLVKNKNITENEKFKVKIVKGYIKKILLKIK